MWELFKIKVPYQQQKVINNLSNNKSIILIQQDKSRDKVVLDRKHYIEKFLSIVESKQFKKLKKDPTKTLESKIRPTWQKIKNVLSENNYKKNFIPQNHARVVKKLAFNLMMPIGFLVKQFILTFSNKYSNIEILVTFF